MMYIPDLFCEEGIDMDALFFRLHATKTFDVSQKELDKALELDYIEDQCADYHLVDQTVNEKNGYRIKHLSNGLHCLDVLEEIMPPTPQEQQKSLRIALAECWELLKTYRQQKNATKKLTQKRVYFGLIKETQNEIAGYRYALNKLTKNGFATA